MSRPDPVSRYLNERAAQIPIPDAGPEHVYRLAARRTRRRRAAVGATAAAFALVAGVVAFGGGDAEPSLEVGSLSAPSAVDSFFEWTEVVPSSGLGYATAAAAFDGTTYAVSTAPGAARADDGSAPKVLYRSGDGVEWSPVALPGGLTPSALAADGSTLYAVGTAPAGGSGQRLVLASSADGTAWSTVDLPDEVAALRDRFEDIVTIGAPSVAVDGEGTVVAAVTATALPQVEDLLPDELEGTSGGLRMTDDGVEVLGPPDEEAMQDCATSTTIAPSAGAAVDVAAGDPAPATGGVRCAGEQGAVIATYTWDDLGVDAELQGLIGGRTYVYRAQGADGLELAATLDGTGGTAALLGSAHGFHLATFGTAEGAAEVLHSADGAAWTRDAALDGVGDGWISGAGLLAGRPAVVASSPAGSSVRVRTDAGWSTIDLREAVDLRAGEHLTFGPAGFGPLGMAVVVDVIDAEGAVDRILLVHLNPEGTEVAVEDLTDAVDGRPVAGLDVNPDAVVLRLVEADDDDADTPPTQTLLVGTPR